MTSTLLTEVEAKVTERMQELLPAYLEYLELEAYAQQMNGFQSPVASVPATAPVAAPAAKPAAKKAAAKAKPASPRTRPGAKKKPAAKKAAALTASDGATVARIKEIVASHPEGIAVGAIIKEGELSTSYTYDVVKRLIESKELAKRNRKIYAVETARTRTPVVSAPTPQAVA